MKLTIENSVTVITPSIGIDTVQEAISSIWEQDYSNITHVVVADGEQHRQPVERAVHSVDSINRGGQKTLITSVPFNTGGNGFYGHRIYAAYSHLVNSDYVMFLDEDNWFKKNHVSTMVKMMDDNPSLAFGYSLRSIYSSMGEYLLDDNCESLGHWPIYWSVGSENPQHLIDTSCFIFRREFLQNTGHLWHSGWGGDRNFYRHTSAYPHDCTGKHTVCYRLDGNPKSVNEAFFKKGNAEMKALYKDDPFPWIK